MPNKLSIPVAAEISATSTAASVSIMTFMGIGLNDWVLILTSLWFAMLIGRVVFLEFMPWCYKKIKNK